MGDEVQQGESDLEADRPITRVEQDNFDRAPFAKRLAETIMRRKDSASLVIGIYGPWGEGKTSVLNMIRNEVETDRTIFSMFFNPWRVDGENALLQMFFKQLADVLDIALVDRKEQLGSLMRTYGTLVSAIPVIGQGTAAAVKIAGDQFGPASIETLYTRISSALREGGNRIVVFIDDIDRLDKSEIQGLFRLIKLTADFSNTIYILAFDQEMVSAALGERFVSEVARYGSAGASYLEKIVQVPLHLPPTTSDNRLQYCYERIDRVLQDSGVDLTQAQSSEFAGCFQHSVALRLKTPRMAVRYANTLAFALGTLRGDTNPVDVMLLEALRVFYTPLYDHVRNNPGEFIRGLDGDSRNASRTPTLIIKERMPTLSDIESQAAALLLAKMFPRFSNIGYSHDFEARWIKEQRICSSSYFLRYFTYGIGDEDISDISIEALFGSGEEDLSSTLGLMLTKANVKKFIEKLRAHETELSPKFAAVYAKALARHATLFSRGGGWFGEKSPWSQAGMLLNRLVALQPTDDRSSLSVQVIENAAPPLFALEFHRWLTAASDDANQTVPVEQQQKIKNALRSLISHYVASFEKPIFTEEPDDAGRYLSTWRLCGGVDDVHNYVTTMIQEFPDSIFDCMRAFMGQAWSGNQRIQPDFDRGNYDLLIQYVNSDLLVEILYKLLVKADLELETYPQDESDLDKKVAQQFMYVHRAVVAAQGTDVIERPSTAYVD